MTTDPDNLAGFNVETFVSDGTVRVAVSGEIDIVVADRLSRVLEDAAATASRVVVDMANLRFIDSTGINAFVNVARKGTPISAINAPRQVRRVLEICGLDQLIPVQLRADERSSGDDRQEFIG